MRLSPRFLLALACFRAAAAPTPEDAAPPPDLVPLFVQRTWHRSDGLFSNEIKGLCLDRAGYLWIGSSAGLARFDGTQFIDYPLPTESARGGGIGALAADPRDGGLLVAPERGGLQRFRDGRFFPVLLPAPLRDHRATALFFAADGAAWATFASGAVLRLEGGEPQVFDARQGLADGRESCVAADGDGRVWISNGPHVWWYQDGSLHFFSLGGHAEDVRIASAHHDGPWLLTRGWLHKIIGDHLGTKLRISGRYNAQSVQAVLEDSGGRVWLATRSRGLRRMSPPQPDDFKVVSTPEDVGCLVQDAAGDIWAGSNGGGLVRLRTGLASRFDRSSGLLENHSLSVCEDHAGMVWIANRDGGVAYLNDEHRIVTVPPLRTLETFSAYALVPAGDTGVWVASSHGILHANATAMTPVPTRGLTGPGADLRAARVLLATREGDLWLSPGPGRIAVLHEGSWTLFGPDDGLAISAVRSLAQDPAGAVWVGTADAGLYVQRAGWFRREPLPVANPGAVQALCFDNAGGGWVGTSAAGIIRLPARPGRVLDQRHGLPDSNITQIACDDRGSLWFGSPHGIFRVRRADLDNFFAGRSERVDAAVIGPDEGLRDATCLADAQPSVWQAHSGLLWFATREGLVAVDPRRDVARTEPLLVRIDRVSADGTPRAAAPAVHLLAQPRLLEIQASALCLATPERLCAQYRLVGYDEGWTTANLSQPIRYQRLPPGEYVFELTAHTAGEPASTNTVRLPISVQAVWWQTGWFRLSGAGLALLVGAVTLRRWSHRRLQSRIARLERLSAVERERARIAQNIHDDLGAALTRISLMTQTVPAHGERHHLDRIYRALTDVTRSMDEIVWAVNPKNDNLENFATYLAEYTQGYLSDAGVRCRVLLPPALPPLALSAPCRHHLFLSCKEALNNVVKHARASEVTLRLQVENQRLAVTIADDGKGAKAAGSEPPRARPQNGLNNLRSRMHALGGTFDIAFSAAGTTVRLSIPLGNEPTLS